MAELQGSVPRGARDFVPNLTPYLIVLSTGGDSIGLPLTLGLQGS